MTHCDTVTLHGSKGHFTNGPDASAVSAKNDRHVTHGLLIWSGGSEGEWGGLRTLAKGHHLQPSIYE